MEEDSIFAAEEKVELLLRFTSAQEMIKKKRVNVGGMVDHLI